MRTKPLLLCTGALLLLAAGRFLVRPDAVRPSAQGETTAAAPAMHWSRSPAARLERSGPPGPADIPPDRPRWETTLRVSELLARLGPRDPAQRAAEIARFVAEQDPAGLEDLLVNDLLADAPSGPALPEDVAQAMLRRVARADAAWTADFLQTLPADTFRGELLGTTMVEWGKTDLPAAVEWAQKLPDAALQATALVHLSYRWFEADPAAALAFAALHAAEHRQLLTTLVGQWSRGQPAAAAAWAAELSQEPVMANVAASAVAAWAQQDDLAAAEFVLQLPEGNLRHEAAISVMSALAQQNPALGSRWVDLFATGPERDYAIESLAYGWAATDADSALIWANRLPAGERDTAIFAGAGGLIERDPARAANWALAIRDESRRNHQAARIAQDWLAKDPPTARAWILSSPLPDAHKQRLLGTL